ncbi:hypothetical protein V499_01459 [Pseudogymnoascus sp. VKM F-103]|nr:hypothetical protein V499_01459 [Pseudogymnoascus sp. VKM F-103]
MGIATVIRCKIVPINTKEAAELATSDAQHGATAPARDHVRDRAQLGGLAHLLLHLRRLAGHGVLVAGGVWAGVHGGVVVAVVAADDHGDAGALVEGAGDDAVFPGGLRGDAAVVGGGGCGAGFEVSQEGVGTEVVLV